MRRGGCQEKNYRGRELFFCTSVYIHSSTVHCTSKSDLGARPLRLSGEEPDDRVERRAEEADRSETCSRAKGVSAARVGSSNPRER